MDFFCVCEIHGEQEVVKCRIIPRWGRYYIEKVTLALVLDCGCNNRMKIKTNE